MRGFNHKKATQALNYFAIKEGGKINKMKAIKLIWLSDKLHLLVNGRTITGDVYFAMKNGTVPSSTRNLLEQNDIALDQEELKYSKAYISPDGFDFFSIGDVELKELSISDISAMENVYRQYGAFDHFKLSDISHEFPEWIQYKSALEKKIASRFEINVKDLFFDAPANQSIFQIDKDIIEESKSIFDNELAVINFFK
jgi:uncharacterized phage-associated protein